MKLQRPGYTETDLMFCRYLKGIGINDNIVAKTENNFIFWLYRNAGWYDSSIPCKGVSFPKYCNNSRSELLNIIKDSYCYRNWIDMYYNSLINSDFLIPLCHKKDFGNHYDNYFSDFISSLNSKNEINKQFDNFWCRDGVIYELIQDKKVLVINSFAELIKQQVDSGNIYKIYRNFPKMTQFISYTFPYTFFNDGPDLNSIKTITKIFNHIQTIDFDIALIAAGCYGCLLVDMIDKIGKTGITMGSRLCDFFGINPRKTDPYWIHQIPQKYIPEGYETIDYGKYWINTDTK